ncbi:MAG: flagellin [Maricaulis sp.]|uniref:flagellin n=1 Tax=Maricaulis sp. TaxID=1486257 RepID=UPI001B0F58CD|nr:flagellin [Maricaulis sp.]MBO6729815.1 flagellin [Maricaulis sp.]MBO6847130.1 flagellin [Maricaulis sp.]MBO6876788.1 flagellin [Maricaulis sp.]
MATINTNAGAMVALQNLNATNREITEVQSRINTGLAVASAKDNGGVYAIAQKMRSDVKSYEAVGNSLDLAASTVDVALAAGEAVSDLLVEMKEKALAASDASLDSASRTALNEDFKALRDQIGKIVSNASFNGTNLINNSVTSISALANASGSSTISIVDENLSLGGGVVTLSATASMDSAGAASTIAGTISTSINNLNASLARLGTASKSLGIHKDFVGKLSDSLEKGIGNLVDADLAKESARLQSLQVKQQLGVQALSIANSAPSTILGYFR